MQPGAAETLVESRHSLIGVLTTSSRTSSQENGASPAPEHGRQLPPSATFNSSTHFMQQMAAAEGSPSFVPELARLLAITTEKCERLERRNAELSTSEAKLRAELLESYCSKMKLMEAQSTLKDLSHTVQRKNVRLKSEIKIVRQKLRKQEASTEHLKIDYKDVCRSKVCLAENTAELVEDLRKAAFGTQKTTFEVKLTPKNIKQPTELKIPIHFTFREVKGDVDNSSPGSSDSDVEFFMDNY